MDLREFDSFYHVDISVQIDNKWSQDTALGIVKDSNKFSIKIKANDKELIKRRFISKEESDSAKKHNKKIVIIIYSYLFYKALYHFSEAKPLLLCRDVRPERLVIHYLQKISRFFNNFEVINGVIKFRKRTEFETNDKLPDSLAGNYIRKVYQGKIPATKILDNSDIKELIEIINKLL